MSRSFWNYAAAVVAALSYNWALAAAFIASPAARGGYVERAAAKRALQARRQTIAGTEDSND